jgi:NADH-quinone oxidoreductase subunit F
LTMPKLGSIQELEAFRTACRQGHDSEKTCLSVCTGSGCTAAGADDVLLALQESLKLAGVQDSVELKNTGCHGFCEKGPVMIVWPEGTFYNQVTARDAAKIVGSVTNGRNPVEYLLYKDLTTGEHVLREEDVPFYRLQQRVLFGNNGKIDPKCIEDYIRLGGYAALGKALADLTPEQAVDWVDRSGLRGRGGAGFPTGKKWRIMRQQPEGLKYIICNADEGDPGAFMDRSLLEGNPHSVIEGMIIGAYALGASEGYVYVRAEYPLAVHHLRIALQQAEEEGLLGDNILGSGLSFRIRLVEGAGAFVCGEETALIASIEGRAGEPRPRPPYPAQKGLWGKPTVINNVKTWASVPVVINRGPDWYAAIGTARSKGTMVFSLVGKINNTGLVEVPMGVTLRKMIYEIGGGIQGGKQLKAVQIGGPSGGCIPTSLIDLPIDYEALSEVGSMMGSGGMVVMDENTCMVDVARYFLEFLQDESCGKCVPCRLGIQQLLRILTDITEGRGTPTHLETLKKISDAMKKGSLCGLGQTAPNPVLTTLRYFEDEYRAHVEKRKCPAGVCRGLIRFSIDAKACTGCRACIPACPVEAISGKLKEPHEINQALCTHCGSCRDVCKFDAVNVE